ncbi:MAG: redoxin domain-containing protein [Phycisphaeraceae bacterium]
MPSRKILINVVLTVAVVSLATYAMQAWAEEQKPVVPDTLSFTLENYDGTKVNLSDYADKIVVLEWINPECPYVVRHYKSQTMVNLANKYKDKNVVWLGLNSSKGQDRSIDAQWAKAHNVPFPILDDHADAKVARQYKAKTTPHMFIIKGGTIVYQGAIDNDPRGNMNDRVNYVDKALTEILADQSVSIPQTKPYGCSMKF